MNQLAQAPNPVAFRPAGIMKLTSPSIFAAQEYFFKSDQSRVRFMDSNFEKWFLSGRGLVERADPETILGFGNIAEKSPTCNIVSEICYFGVPRVPLAYVFCVMSHHFTAPEASILSDEGTIFLVRDQASRVRTVFLNLGSGGVLINAEPFAFPKPVGAKIFFQCTKNTFVG